MKTVIDFAKANSVAIGVRAAVLLALAGYVYISKELPQPASCAKADTCTAATPPSNADRMAEGVMTGAMISMTIAP